MADEEREKWISMAASIWIQSTSGGSYTFSIYSSALKSSQSYSQSTLDTVSVFKDIGANAGVLSGVLYAFVASDHHRARRRGPWIVHLTGAVIGFLGYFLMWLSVIGEIRRPPVPVMCVFMLLAAQAQTFFNTANVVTAVRNFPDYSGTVVGIMKGFLGLSGAILIQVYRALFNGNPTTFILMLALLPTIVSLVLMCSVSVYPTSQTEYKKHLNGFSIVALVVASYLMIIIILENIFTFPLWARLISFLLLLMLLSSPLKVAFRAQSEQITFGSSLETPSENDPLVQIPDPHQPDKRISEDPSDQDHELPGNMNLMEAMSALNFWLLFIAMACGMGSGLATINNMSQIGESLGYNSVQINTLVSLWSIWNFLGRFGAGYVSDILLQKNRLARPFLMAVTLATMAAGHVIIAVGFPGNLYVGTVLVGVCYGSQWSLMPTITSEVFGVLHMGTIFNTIAIASPVGSYALSVWVVGKIYDTEAVDGSGCSGAHCFMLSFFILASVSFFGFLVASALFLRTREFYRSVVLRRLRNLLR